MHTVDRTRELTKETVMAFANRIVSIPAFFTRLFQKVVVMCAKPKTRGMMVGRVVDINHYKSSSRDLVITADIWDIMLLLCR